MELFVLAKICDEKKLSLLIKYLMIGLNKIVQGTYVLINCLFNVRAIHVTDNRLD